MISDGIYNNQFTDALNQDDYHNGHFERIKELCETALMNSLRVSFEGIIVFFIKVQQNLAADSLGFRNLPKKRKKKH
jgi:hypothetical protein